MARRSDYLFFINRVTLTATDTRAYTHTHTHARSPGIGRPMDGDRLDLNEFLHRNNGARARTELGGKRHTGHRAAVGEPLRGIVVPRAIRHERLRRRPPDDIGVSREHVETVGHHGVLRIE